MKFLKSITFVLLLGPLALPGCKRKNAVVEEPKEILKKEFFEDRPYYKSTTIEIEQMSEEEINERKEHNWNVARVSAETITTLEKNGNLYSFHSVDKQKDLIPKFDIAYYFSVDESSLTVEQISTYFSEKHYSSYQAVDDSWFEALVTTSDTVEEFRLDSRGIMADVHKQSTYIYSGNLYTENKFSRRIVDYSYAKHSLLDRGFDLLSVCGTWNGDAHQYVVTTESLKAISIYPDEFINYSVSLTKSSNASFVFKSIYERTDYFYQETIDIKFEQPEIVFPINPNPCQHEAPTYIDSYYNDKTGLQIHYRTCPLCNDVMVYEDCHFNEDGVCSECHHDQKKLVCVIPEIDYKVTVDAKTNQLISIYMNFDLPYTHFQSDYMYKLNTDDIDGYDFKEGERIYWTYLYFKDGLFYDVMETYTNDGNEPHRIVIFYGCNIIYDAATDAFKITGGKTVEYTIGDVIV